ncbi:uncharacterized protein EDB91DRAFT_1088190 [Suillus paluster]|uniref:uncharacterized protein n=1 Tax=Suillus paluster TaxID=48578 RepID=UPI001B874430|nr:uncharacterized protein EDB91DRAFT_1088190 [Suillus paluster]KAG1722282.1 hypothetical protein EDB91DRAFT_1088190 [Suillus paluster]
MEELPTPPSTPAPRSYATNKAVQLLNLIGSLTPSTKKLVHALSRDPHVHVPSPSMALTTTSAAIPDSDAVVFKASNTVFTKTNDRMFNIPQPILNLTKAKLHVPLTLLTSDTLWRIHANPSSIKMKKGLVLSDPKLVVMDASAGFPVETSLPADQYYEATNNFLRLMDKIANTETVKHFTDHCQFCIDLEDFSLNFEAVLNFNIEIYAAAYLRHWNKINIKTTLAASRPSGSGSNSQFNLYPPHKAANDSSSSVDAKSFRKGKGSAPTDTTLCIICGQHGHRASSCTFTHTIKNTPIISTWIGKLLLKTNQSPICIFFNLG